MKPNARTMLTVTAVLVIAAGVIIFAVQLGGPR